MAGPITRQNLFLVIVTATTTANTTAATSTIKRRDSFSNLSTVVEVVEEAEEDPSVVDRKSNLSSQRGSLRNQTEAPQSLASQTEAPQSLISALDNGPQSLFSQPDASMVLPDAPTDVPPMLIPAKNPKLYQLVQMSGESSFWWDSSESADAGAGGFVQNFATFESSMNDAVVDGTIYPTKLSLRL